MNHPEAPPSGLRQRAAWLLPLLLVLALVPAGWPTLTVLFRRWTDWSGPLGHGLVVVALFLVLLWRSLPWPARPAAPPLAALLGLGGLSLGWSLAVLARIDLAQQLLLLALLVALLAGVHGAAALRRHWPLPALLLFALPVWAFLDRPLVALATWATGGLVRLLGIPAYIEGPNVLIPSGHFLIADGCSGLRYLLVALLLAAYLGLVNRYRARQALAVLAVAAGLAVIMNWLRITTIIAIGHLTEMQSPLVADHEWLGWALFAAACLPALWLAPPPASRPASRPADSSARPTDAAATSSPPDSPRVAGALLALALGPLLLLAVDRDPVPVPLAASLPAGWTAITPAQLPAPLRLPAGGLAEHARVDSAAGPIYAQAWQHQRSQRADKLVPALPGRHDRWRQAAAPAPAGQPGRAQQLQHLIDGRRVAELHWYEVGRFRTGSRTAAKLLQLPALLAAENHFRLVSLQQDCGYDDCAPAWPQLAAAARELAAGAPPARPPPGPDDAPVRPPAGP